MSLEARHVNSSSKPKESSFDENAYAMEESVSSKSDNDDDFAYGSKAKVRRRKR